MHLQSALQNVGMTTLLAAQVAINAKGTHLAAADDAGDVQVSALFCFPSIIPSCPKRFWFCHQFGPTAGQSAATCLPVPRLSCN